MKSNFLIFWKELLTEASASEKKGFLVLLLLSFGVVIYQFTTKINIEKNTPIISVSNYQNSGKVVKSISVFENNDFYINPNLVSEDTLKLVGLSDYSIENWLQKQESNFIFRDKIDVLRVKGVTKKQFFQLEKHLVFGTEKPSKFHSSYSKKQNWKYSDYSVKSKSNVTQSDQPKNVFDLNLITQEELLSLGIRDFIAERFLKFREKLGGFSTKNQLKEIYGISKKDLVLLSEQKISHTNVRVLDVKNLTFKEILKHPYLEYEHVKVIVKYRDTAKVFQKQRLLQILPDSVSYKIAPYL